MKHEITAENEFGIYIEFNGYARAELTLFLVSELVRIAHLKSHFGPDAIVEIVEISRGSLWAKIGIPLATIATIGGFALQIEDRLRTKTERLSQCTAQIVLEGGAQAVQLLTCTGPIEILKEEMPAVRKFMAEKTAQESVTNWHDYFNKPPRSLPDVPREPTVAVTRTTGAHPTVDGRPVELLDDSVVFGTRRMPRSNVRFLDNLDDDLIATSNGLRGKVQVFGQFELNRRLGKGLIFRTGDALFMVDLPDGQKVPSIGIPVIAQVQIDPRKPDSFTLHSWDALES